VRRRPFGRRHLLVAGLLLCLAAGSADAAGEAPKPDPFPIKFGGPFELVDPAGRTRMDADFRGRFMLVFFGYATCPDICPTDLQIIADALDLLGTDADRIQPLFITVDPRRDRADRLGEFVAHFHPRMIGLTGSAAQVQAAARAYKVHRRKVVLADAKEPDDYLVDHSSITYLMGPDGAFVTLFPHDSDPAFMAKAIRKYLR
jgi:protein SCO1